MLIARSVYKFCVGFSILHIHEVLICSETLVQCWTRNTWGYFYMIFIKKKKKKIEEKLTLTLILLNCADKLTREEFIRLYPHI